MSPSGYGTRKCLHVSIVDTWTWDVSMSPCGYGHGVSPCLHMDMDMECLHISMGIQTTECLHVSMVIWTHGVSPCLHVDMRHGVSPGPPCEYG